MNQTYRLWASLLACGILSGCIVGSNPSGNDISPATPNPAVPTGTPVVILLPAGPEATVTALPPPLAVATNPPPASPTGLSSPTPSAWSDAVQPINPIQLPPGFAISQYAQGLDAPRMMTIGPDGWLYVAESGAGQVVRFPARPGEARAGERQVVAQGLNAPTSLAFFKDGSLYVGETTRILRLSEPDAQGVFQKLEVVIGGLPSGGHRTRTVLFSPDWSTLLVSIGSSCNVCLEKDDRRAAILQYKPDGTGGQVFARGLRNAVGITFRPGTDELWATNNGRDWLGDNLPPETVNLVKPGDDFGWPRCHAGRLVDPDFGGPGSCGGVAKPVVEMQAHSAPLGLAFYSGNQFPADYQGSLFVAFHGSWNRSVPTGYKIVRIPFKAGKPGPVQDFAAGWLVNGSSWGRPVDPVIAPDGSLFVSDDGSGSVYRIYYTGK